MKIEIVTNNSDSDSLVREYTQRTLTFALGQFGTRISRVVARLQRPSAELTAFDSLCSIEVELVPNGHLHVSADGESAFDSVLQAVHKMEQAVKQEIDRSQQSSRMRHQQANGKPDGRIDDPGESASGNS